MTDIDLFVRSVVSFISMRRHPLDECVYSMEDVSPDVLARQAGIKARRAAEDARASQPPRPKKPGPSPTKYRGSKRILTPPIVSEEVAEAAAPVTESTPLIAPPPPKPEVIAPPAMRQTFAVRHDAQTIVFKDRMVRIPDQLGYEAARYLRVLMPGQPIALGLLLRDLYGRSVPPNAAVSVRFICKDANEKLKTIGLAIEFFGDFVRMTEIQ